MPPKDLKINDALRESAATAAKARSEAVVKKLYDTMALIDKEIEANEGIYPGGKLNQRELCRRADVHYQTLQQPTHKDTLKRVVDEWLESKTTKTLSDSRKAVTDRAVYWKEQHQKVATQISIYEAEFAEKNSRIAELEEMVDQLQQQVSLLQKNKVSTLTAVRKDKE